MFITTFAAALSLSSALSFAASPRVVSVPPGDCAAIEKAIRHLPVTGGTVQLSEGEYDCHSPVVIDRDNVTLAGAGSGKTVLKTEAGKALPLLVIGALKMAPEHRTPTDVQYYPVKVVSGVSVHGLTLDGNRGALSLAEQHNLECFDPSRGISLSCDNDGGKFIRNNGLTIRRGNHIRVNDIEANGNFSGGVVLEKKSKDVIMDGFHMNNNYYDGFAGYETTGSVFRNFQCKDNAYSGISVDLRFEGNRFEHGTIRNNGDNGIFSRTVSNNTYDDLEIRDNKTYAAFAVGDSTKNPDGSWNTRPHTCDGNQFLNLKVSGNVQGAISIGDNCKGVRLESSHISTVSKDQGCFYAGRDSEVQGENECAIGKPLASPAAADAEPAKAEGSSAVEGAQ